ncbi:hypothetical protein GALMADRAFT_233343 [Galerina marginata CBS 339.88]|uniref:Uncharacterized protein n=1 Tax=Galerina marginata (strain CBS 339.88) TaxID=685588 RepID=A0A067TRF1_GALM3|nr:hypothetical protein GALMADRAFT_233343 [Galerina marginata CBS 339.88]
MVFAIKRHTDSKDNEAARRAAAVLIQRLWRGRHNLAKNRHLTAKLRWDDVATHAVLETHRHAALDSESTPKERWQRAAFLIGQLNYKNDMLSSNGIQVEADEKYLETQHWLELIDGKHRYGSNC